MKNVFHRAFLHRNTHLKRQHHDLQVTWHTNYQDIKLLNRVREEDLRMYFPEFFHVFWFYFNPAIHPCTGLIWTVWVLKYVNFEKANPRKTDLDHQSLGSEVKPTLNAV